MQGGIVSDIKNDAGKVSFYFLPDDFEQYILVSLQGRTDLRYGQIISISGKLQLPKNTTFDYVGYLAKENVYARMSYAQIIVIEQSSRYYPSVIMFTIKAWYDRRVSAILATTEAGLVKGILLGDKADIPDEVIKLFQKTGTGHMVAVSGFNITIIIAVLVHGFRYFGRRLGIVVLQRSFGRL
jgi:competence protein ComEC